MDQYPLCCLLVTSHNTELNQRLTEKPNWRVLSEVIQWANSRRDSSRFQSWLNLKYNCIALLGGGVSPSSLVYAYIFLSVLCGSACVTLYS